jgi:hypothetical protein
MTLSCPSKYHLCWLYTKLAAGEDGFMVCNRILSTEKYRPALDTSSTSITLDLKHHSLHRSPNELPAQCLAKQFHRTVLSCWVEPILVNSKCNSHEALPIVLSIIPVGDVQLALPASEH